MLLSQTEVLWFFFVLLPLTIVLFGQVINKHFWMNTSIDLESLIEMPQHFGWVKCLHKKKIDI